MPESYEEPQRSLLCVVPYPTNTGFAWNYIEQLYAGIATALRGDGVRTLVAYTRLDEPPATLQGSAAEPIELDATLGTMESVAAVIRAIRTFGIETIYFTDLGTYHWSFPLLRLAGVRWIVAHDHTSGHRDRPLGIRRIMKAIRSRLPWVVADRVLTVSEYVARRQREVALIPPTRVHCVLNGVSVAQSYIDPPLLPELEAFADRPLVVCACRAAKEKGVDILFRAFAELVADSADLHTRPVLLYAGTGPEFESLLHLRDSIAAADDIVLLGYRRDVPELIRRATICVVPSLWDEACPLGVLEPMAMAKPVIASAVGGVPEQIIDSSVGSLVPRGDVRALAEAMRQLLADPEARREIGENARRRIESSFSPARQISALVAHLVPDRMKSD